MDNIIGWDMSFDYGTLEFCVMTNEDAVYYVGSDYNEAEVCFNEVAAECSYTELLAAPGGAYDPEDEIVLRKAGTKE